MSKHETGGPAFPTGEKLDRSGQCEQYMVEGMTLRDYFAAKAMQSFLAGFEGTLRTHDLANSSYQIADAMLEARK